MVVHDVDMDAVGTLAGTGGARDPVELVGQMGDVAVEDRGVNGRHRNAPQMCFICIS